MNAELAPWLQLGVFEGMMFPRTGPDGNTLFNANLLNPIIGVRGFQSGLEVQKVYGLNYKFTLPKYIVLYGQLMINSMKGSMKSYERRWGVQGGVKYWDMFGVDNLNMQVEYNYIRPYSYTSEDSVLHYCTTHSPWHTLWAPTSPKWSAYLITASSVSWQNGASSMPPAASMP